MVLYMHFSSFKNVVKQYLVSAILHHNSLLRLSPKSYLKISTFQPNFLCSSYFKRHGINVVPNEMWGQNGNLDLR